MKKITLLMIIISSHFLNCKGAALEQPQPFATHNLSIFLDTSERTMVAVAKALYDALSDQAGPIIASTSLLQTILNTPNLQEIINNKASSNSQVIVAQFLLDEYTRINQYLTKAINQQLKKQKTLPKKAQQEIFDRMDLFTVSEFEKYKKKVAHYSSALKDPSTNVSQILSAEMKTLSPFIPNDWIIKQVNPDLLLMIPRKYMQTLQQKKINLPQSKSFTQQELLLGLKIDHLLTVDSLSAFVKNYVPHLSNQFSQIFITNQEYAQVNAQSNNKAPIPSWAFFIMGHGNPGKIAGMTTQEFKNVLEFFVTIRTKLVAYISCYGAGTNTTIVYTDLKTKLLKTYPFTIITAALTDSPLTIERRLLITAKYSIEHIDFNKKKLMPKNIFQLNFTKFFAALAASTVNYEQAFSYIWPQPTSQEMISNFPQIKLPGIPWFNVADTNKKVVSIGNVMAKTRTQPLDITKFFKKEPLVILLQTQFIPFPITISMNSMPTLVSMGPGQTFTIFEDLQIPNITLQNFIASFEPIKNTPLAKIYFFKKLTLKEKNKAKTYRNIVVWLENKTEDLGPHTGLTVYHYPQQQSVMLYDFATNTWQPAQNSQQMLEFKQLIEQTAQDDLEQVQKFIEDLHQHQRLEAPQPLILPGQKVSSVAKAINDKMADKKKKVAAKTIPKKTPAGKLPAPKMLSTIQQAKLKKLQQAKLAKAKKQAAKKKQLIAKKKKAAIKGKKVIKKKPVVQKKMKAAKALK